MMSGLGICNWFALTYFKVNIYLCAGIVIKVTELRTAVTLLQKFKVALRFIAIIHICRAVAAGILNVPLADSLTADISSTLLTKVAGDMFITFLVIFVHLTVRKFNI